MQPCECRACDNCPCPTSLPVVLREWTGDWDFTNDRDITQMPGWSRALEHNRAKTAVGYLWRIVGFNWQQLEEAGPVGFYYPWTLGIDYLNGVSATNCDTLAIGPVRDLMLKGQNSLLANAFGVVGGCLIAFHGEYRNAYQDSLSTISAYNFGFASKLGHFGVKHAEVGGSLLGKEWKWIGSDEVDGYGSHTWARYQLQLGVIRCNCQNGLYINWPTPSVALPSGMLLIDQIQGGLTVERLEIPPSSYAGRIVFGTRVADGLPSEVAWNGTAQDVVNVLSAVSWAGYPIVDISASGGPLPFNSIEVSYRFTGGFAGTRITPDFSHLMVPLTTIRCRRMLPIEEDAKAWSGNEADPEVEQSCAVDVGVDWQREVYAEIFDRIGWFEYLQGGEVNVELSPRLRYSDLTHEKVLILGNEGLQRNPSVGHEASDADSMLANIKSWLDRGGKCLVLTGGVTVLADDASACSTSSGVDNPAHYQSRSWNYVLSSLGSGCSLTGIGIPSPAGLSCPEAFSILLTAEQFSVGTHYESTGGDAANYVRLTPASGLHTLLENASEIEVTKSLDNINGHPVGYFPLDFVGNITPGPNCTTLYEITAAWCRKQYTSPESRHLDDVLPGVVLEELSNGSWIIHVAVFNKFGGPNPIGDVFSRLPGDFLSDILRKLPYS